MKDWVIALIVAAAIVWGIFVLPWILAALSLVLTPVLILVCLCVVIWFIIQILKPHPPDGGDTGAK